MPLSNRVCFGVNLRDALCCRQCGSQPQAQTDYHKGYEYHHRIPRSQGGPDTIENIVLLCKACHQASHNGNSPLGELDLSPISLFFCLQCQATLDSQTVEMNCGWYFCPLCQRQTHLFEHFYGQSS